ncbi:hypothetical protein LPJ73_000044 [Coemansia sp. RSA 2703]|nr:hypothetical protein LPJ73_000044 [Coemansia sp. RSA 2703]KAJ2379399.1 hypothetical protein IW150_000192 [Coemansia sp. RSA 2607]KAJ2398424.1 hypothetical protein GGI05_000085 [Coemansia sp. RSA 2603]
MVTANDIEKLIETNIGDIHKILIEDVSGGCGSMFNVMIVSDKFKGLLRLKQHKLVHQALGDKMKELHALTLKLYTEDQYQKILSESAEAADQSQAPTSESANTEA